MKKIDWSKPVVDATGSASRTWRCVDLVKVNSKDAYLITDQDPDNTTHLVVNEFGQIIYGRYVTSDEPMVKNKSCEHKGWINIFPNRHVMNMHNIQPHVYRSEKEARNNVHDAFDSDVTVITIPIEWEE